MRLSDIQHSPALLLFITGGLLGLTFPFGKMATEASVSPLVWAWVIAAGSGSALLLIQWASKKSVPIRSDFLRFYVLSSLCALVLPNVLIFTVIPKLGSGFTGILFTLSPIFTLTLSSIWRVQLPSRLGLAGIAVGFVGALVVTLTRGELGQPAGIAWVLTGLLIPVSLAIGNVHRTLAWPTGATPLQLAIGTNLAAASILMVLILTTADIADFGRLNSVKTLVLLQVIGSTAMFSVFFRLQEVGGPTYLSQIGYVAAAVALFSGTLFLNERYSAITWIGAAVIVAGIGLSVRALQPRTP